VLRLDEQGRPQVLSDIVLGQAAQHAPYKGVVPEIAARAHVEGLDATIAQAMRDSGVGFSDLDGVAATAGPGLIGGVMVGLLAGKAVALAHDKPLIAVNHLEGHALTARLTDGLGFPYLLLLVSGGHCQLLTVRGPGDFTRLGTTIDDAVGECFDKTAKLLGLGFPGGPAVERVALGGDPKRFALPRPMWRKPGCDFSFSGLKTAVRQAAEKLPANDAQAISDLCASFQRTVGDVLADRCANALLLAPSPTLVVAGGVAANIYLRGRLEEIAARYGARLVAPPIELCTDNGAMIAWAGLERLRLGKADALDFRPRPRWPLDPLAA
jgi:N6-L-threonylcarbamoyladenine synthase